MKLTINQALMERLRALPEKAKSTMRRKVREVLKPEMKQLLDSLLPLNPGPPSNPFQFGTDKSLRYYFWLISAIDGLTDGKHWIRTGEVDSGFDIEVSDRLQANLVTVLNRHPAAKYVYGPWQVAGHKNTGWQTEANALRQLLLDYAIRRSYELWVEAVRENLKP